MAALWPKGAHPGRWAACVQASELLAADVVPLALEHSVLQSRGVVMTAGTGTKSRLTAVLLPERSKRCYRHGWRGFSLCRETPLTPVFPLFKCTRTSLRLSINTLLWHYCDWGTSETEEGPVTEHCCLDSGSSAPALTDGGWRRQTAAQEQKSPVAFIFTSTWHPLVMGRDELSISVSNGY